MLLMRVYVPGTPKPQPRPRAFARRMGDGKYVARVYDAGTAEAWKSSIALAVRDQQPITPWDGPLSVTLSFWLRRPKRLLRTTDPDGPMPHSGRGDVDNYAKAVLDALTDLGFWRDDGQVWQLHVEKYYAAKGDGPSARIEVRRADAEGTHAQQHGLAELP